jgi:hypothetical protein
LVFTSKNVVRNEDDDIEKKAKEQSKRKRNKEFFA